MGLEENLEEKSVNRIKILTNFGTSTPERMRKNYSLYVKLGGFLDEEDYKKAIDKAEEYLDSTLERGTNDVLHRKDLIAQTNSIARRSGFALRGIRDPRVAIYNILHDILRKDAGARDKYKDIRMSDQRLFTEALRIAEDTDSLNSFIREHPHMPEIRNMSI